MSMSCSCSRHRTGYGCCVSCGNRTSTIRSEDMPYSLNTENGRFGSGAVLQCIPRWVFCVISTALMTFFAFAGAFAGAIAGAVAGRASDSGVFRGAGLGAIAGAILTLEVLEASRAYWCLEQSGSRSASSMADFIEELLRGRFVEEQFTPAMLTAYRWQVSIANVSYDEIRDIYGGVAYRGLSSDSLKKLPCHVIKDDIKAGQSICCTICLQDIVSGETVRSLPRCRHSFHLTCVDKWLIRHGSCPICRQSM